MRNKILMGAYLEHFSSTTHRGLGNQEISESAPKTPAPHPPPPPPAYNHLWTTTRGSRIIQTLEAIHINLVLTEQNII